MNWINKLKESVEKTKKEKEKGCPKSLRLSPYSKIRWGKQQACRIQNKYR